jgi:hypothetical protein
MRIRVRRQLVVLDCAASATAAKMITAATTTRRIMNNLPAEPAYPAFECAPASRADSGHVAYPA